MGDPLGMAPVSSAALSLWVSFTASLLSVFKALGKASMASFPQPQARGEGMANPTP